jgi:hypothetical protein
MISEASRGQSLALHREGIHPIGLTGAMLSGEQKLFVDLDHVDQTLCFDCERRYSSRRFR